MSIFRLSIAGKLYAILALLACAALALAAFGVAAARRNADMVGSFGDTAFWMTFFVVAAVAFAGLGASMVGRHWRQPLADLRRAAEAAAAGRKADIPHRDRGDEIGALATALAALAVTPRMAGETDGAGLDAQADGAGRHERAARDIAGFGADIEKSLAELLTLSTEMHRGSQHIAEGVATTSQLTARASAASAAASSNVNDIASAADELTSSVREIERQVAQSNDIAMKAVGEAAQTNVTVKELNEAAGRIGDVVRMINDIAAQTNLLALNATIEAARAGDAGRGFAVVAGEVKALAGQTAKATDEITAQIAAMQAATGRSIEAIAIIERTIREIGDISGAIAAAVTEQGAATQEIARSVETASQRTTEAAEQVSGVNAIAETTNRHATEARTVADNLGAVAAHIRGEVERFFQRLDAA